MEQARAGLAQAQAAFWPTLQVETSYSVTNNSAFAFSHILNQEAFSPDLNFNDVSSVDDLNAKASVQLPLFTGLARFARRDAAEAATEAAERSAEAIQKQLGFQVTQTYFTILKARALIRAAKAAEVAYASSLETARNRFDAGALLKQAVLDLEVRLARAEEDRVRAENAQALAIEMLRNLMGLSRDEPITVADGAEGFSPPPSEDADPSRPELASRAAGLRRAEASEGVARAGYWPRANAFASLIYDQGFIEDGNKLSYLAGVGIEWTLWDGLLTRNRVRQAEAETAAARAELERLRLAVDLDVAQARIRVEEARRRIEVIDKAVGLAEESAHLTRARFEQGVALSTQLIDAETALTGARVRLAEAQSDLRIAQAALNQALGRPQIENQ